MDFLEELVELNPDALLADDLEPALVGYTLNHHHAHVAVYDYDKCIQVLRSQGLDEEEADEYLSYNTLGAWVGENGPLFVKIRGT